MPKRTRKICSPSPAEADPVPDILPDSLDYGLVLVFCGTAASQVSACAQAYYANPGNAFWPALFQAGITSRLRKPAEFPALLDVQIGFTDLVKYRAGSDSQLRHADYDPQSLRQKIARYQPQIVAFTSKTAWRAWACLPSATPVSYGWQARSQDTTRFFVLPSPSGAARRYWDLQPWRILAAEYARRRKRDMRG